MSYRRKIEPPAWLVERAQEMVDSINARWAAEGHAVSPEVARQTAYKVAKATFIPGVTVQRA